MNGITRAALRLTAALMTALLLVGTARASARTQTASTSADHVQTTMLLTPSGHPVGGRWQRWVEHSYAPTLQGPMVLAFSTRSTCAPGYDPPASDIAACTGGATFTPVTASVTWYPETLINTSDLRGEPFAWRRWLLLYEHGHVIDFTYLTDALRGELLTIWDQPPLPAGEQMSQYWWDGESRGQGRVYGEWFAESYALCALYRSWNRADYINAWDAGRMDSYGTTYPGWGASERAIKVQSATCALIRSVAA